MIDNSMKWLGETDTTDKVIRINKNLHHKDSVKSLTRKGKRKAELLDTIVHEEMHARHPRMHEKTVYKKTREKVKKLTQKQKHKLYSRFQ